MSSKVQVSHGVRTQPSGGRQGAGRRGQVFDFATATQKSADMRYPGFVKWMTDIADRSGHAVKLMSIGESSGLRLRETNYAFYYALTESAPREMLALDLPPKSKTVKGHVVVIAGHHATEPAGAMAAMEFTERLLASRTPLAMELKEHYRVTVIPLVDVDNYSLPLKRRPYSMRTNNFYDRLEEKGPEWDEFGDYKKPLRAGPEARNVASMLREWSEHSPRMLVFDLHESADEGSPASNDGFYITAPYGFPREDLLEVSRAQLVAEELPVDSVDPWHGLWSPNRPGRPQMCMDYAQSLGQDGSVVALTQESAAYEPDNVTPISPELRVAEHLCSMDAILGRYLQEGLTESVTSR